MLEGVLLWLAVSDLEIMWYVTVVEGVGRVFFCYLQCWLCYRNTLRNVQDVEKGKADLMNNDKNLLVLNKSNLT